MVHNSTICMWMVEATASKGDIYIYSIELKAVRKVHPGAYIKDRENVLMTILNAENPIVIDSMWGNWLKLFELYLNI